MQREVIVFNYLPIEAAFVLGEKRPIRWYPGNAYLDIVSDPGTLYREIPNFRLTYAYFSSNRISTFYASVAARRFRVVM